MTPRTSLSMSVLAEGTIESDAGLKNLFWTVLRKPRINFAVIRLWADDGTVIGEMGVSYGLYLVGARVRLCGLQGYAALRRLVGINAGYYEYLDFSSSYQSSLDNGFRIRLTDLVTLCPDLPECVEDIACSRTSLHRIRSFSKVEHEEQARTKEHYTKLKAFEKRTMRYRAPVFWSAFMLLSCVATLIWRLAN